MERIFCEGCGVEWRHDIFVEGSPYSGYIVTYVFGKLGIESCQCDTCSILLERNDDACYMVCWPEDSHDYIDFYRPFHYLLYDSSVYDFTMMRGRDTRDFFSVPKDDIPVLAANPAGYAEACYVTFCDQTLTMTPLDVSERPILKRNHSNSIPHTTIGKHILRAADTGRNRKKSWIAKLFGA